jgi:carboxymethylenebutenolidase
MGSTIKLKAQDGHEFDAYLATPQGKPKGGVVVIQEIFGVNAHIREVTERFAKEGYAAIAPAFFDRAQRNFESGYAAKDIEYGRSLVPKAPVDKAMLDAQAAIDDLARHKLKVGVTGYCWGGSMTWAAACRANGLSAASSYYGGMVLGMADEKPKCPVEFHFGETDASIPIDKVKEFQSKRPELPMYIYPAGHGFLCDHRASYHKESAEKAFQRTLEFFAKNLA